MQLLHPLAGPEATDIEAKRDWVRNHFEPESRHRYDSLDGKLRLLDTILSNRWVEPNETLKLQCLGVTFGDALEQELGMKWVLVEDEYGRDPALSFENSSVLAFPLTSISKRVERGEELDVYELFANACSTIRDTKQREA